ncbi:MAG: hypothetical protein U5J64_11285 [Halobacteriales archaeon]|nr:hypothetical protein [Halobacteriales archaeon]
MPRNDLVDKLVADEFGVFASDPLGYTAERDRATERLVRDGVDEKTAREAWTEFERRYLTTGDGGTTFSVHGLDRANALGENVAVDEDVRAATYEALRDEGGRASVRMLREKVGASDDVFEQSLWTLRRRGVVETRTDTYTDVRSVSLTEPRSEDEEEDGEL